MDNIAFSITEGLIVVSVPFYDPVTTFAIVLWLVAFVVKLILNIIKALPGL